MSQMNPPSETWKGRDQKNLSYSNWFAVEHKGTTFFLVLVALFGLYSVWLRSGEWSFLLAASGLSLLMGWSIFIPIHIDIGSDGITRWVLGRKRFVAWEQIRSYRVQNGGILLLPQSERFALESFGGLFVPVPGSLSSEVLFRFRFHVDRIVE